MGILMTIFDHGTWIAYDPIPYPDGLPAGIAFAKNDVSDRDWYEYQRDEVSAESVKLLCFREGTHWIVRIATVEQSRVFPIGGRLLELYDGDLDNPQGSYVGLMYDDEANALVDAPPVVIVPSSASKLGLRRVFVERGTWDHVKALIASSPDTQEEWDLATEIKRTDPLVQGLILALSLQPADVDAILIRAKELIA